MELTESGMPEVVGIPDFKNGILAFLSHKQRMREREEWEEI